MNNIKAEAMSLPEEDEILSECEKSTITEMLAHFSTPIKSNHDEERYIYSKRILDKFLNLNKNPQVQIRQESIDNTYSYYVVFRPFKKCRSN